MASSSRRSCSGDGSSAGADGAPAMIATHSMATACLAAPILMAPPRDISRRCRRVPWLESQRSRRRYESVRTGGARPDGATRSVHAGAPVGCDATGMQCTTVATTVGTDAASVGVWCATMHVAHEPGATLPGWVCATSASGTSSRTSRKPMLARPAVLWLRRRITERPGTSRHPSCQRMVPATSRARLARRAAINRDAMLVALDDVALGYDGRPVLEHVSFGIEPGEFVALLGPNGAGKTPLFRGMLGLIPVLSGRITYGFDRRLQPPGYVPQKETLDPIFPLTVFEVVVMGTYAGLAPLRPIRHRQRATAAACLEQVGLADLTRQPFWKLSGGQR